MVLFELESLLQKSFFLRSYSDINDWIQESKLPEIAFVGRSNSGKSSVINAILGKKNLAKTSHTPGKTRLINVYEAPNSFYLVDLPGYGYSKASKSEHKQMMQLLEDYLNKSRRLQHIFLLLDSRREIPQEESEFVYTARKRGINLTFLRTKSDKLNQKERSLSVRSTYSLTENYIFVSVISGTGIPEIKNILYQIMMKD